MITEEDRAKYQCSTDSTILGFKLIGSLTDETLFQIADGSEVKLHCVRGLIGKDTNPKWIKARVAEELYERDLIDEKRLDQLMN